MQVDGAERPDADRVEWPVARQELNRLPDCLARLAGCEDDGVPDVVGPGSDGADPLRAARLDPAQVHRLTGQYSLRATSLADSTSRASCFVRCFASWFGLTQSA